MNDVLTVKEMLGEVNNAIYAVLVGGQSYQIGSRKMTRADLKLLNEMKNDLTAQVASFEESNLIADTTVAIFSGR